MKKNQKTGFIAAVNATRPRFVAPSQVFKSKKRVKLDKAIKKADRE